MFVLKKLLCWEDKPWLKIDVWINSMCFVHGKLGAAADISMELEIIMLKKVKGVFLIQV